MNRVLAGTTAALLLGASGITAAGVHLTHAASGNKNAYYADALLWPYQGGNGSNGSGSNGSSNNGNNGNSQVLWQDANVPGGALAILTGQGSNLDYILHAKYLMPNQSYTAYISQSACNSGNGRNGNGAGGAGANGNGNGNNNSNSKTPLGNDVLGKQTSDAGGNITLVGKLDTKRLPPSMANGGNGSSSSNNGNGNNNVMLSVHVELTSMLNSSKSSSNNSSMGMMDTSYCGDILTPQAVIPLKSVNGSKALGIAMVSRDVNIWWHSSNTLWGNGGAGGNGGNNATQVVVFVHGVTPNAVHEEHIHQGTCGGSEGMIEYPLTDIEANSSGEGVAGTLLNTTVNILNFPDAMGNKNAKNPPSSEQLSINVHGVNFKPTACGNLPYSSNSKS